MHPHLRKAARWLSGADLLVLLAVLVLLGGVWAFALIAGEVKAGDTEQFDKHILRALRTPDDPDRPIGPPWSKEVGRDLTALGGIAVLCLITLAVAGFLLICRAYGATLLVLAATLGGLLLSNLLKGLYNRPRPDVVPQLSDVMTTSFPSGHSMMSAIVYLTLGTLLARLVERPLLKVYLIVVALLVTGLVGVSRVWMGVHYPTDVLAGWSAGLAWAIVCWLVARWLQRRGAVEQSVDEPDTELA
jgi:undecaprenyl-diphosphatase